MNLPCGPVPHLAVGASHPRLVCQLLRLLFFYRGCKIQNNRRQPNCATVLAISRNRVCNVASSWPVRLWRSMPRWLYPALSLAARHQSRNSCYFNFFRVARHQNLRAEERA